MELKNYLEGYKEYARDTKLNLGTVLTPEGAPGLSPNQIGVTALACAYAAKSPRLRAAVEAHFAPTLSDAERGAAQIAATLMAMNNVYYRTLHLAENEELNKLPARLRMNGLAKPGTAKVDFELACLAVSAIAGCGKCIKAHLNEVAKAGVTTEAIHSTLRIASVIQSAAQVDFIG